MRKATNLLVAAAALSVLVLASPAFATHFWTENFGYPDGGLVAVSGGNWVTHSGSAGDIQVVSNVCNLMEITGYDKDDNRSFPARTNTDITYACFRFRLPDPQGTPALGYFAHFKDSGTFNFASRVYVAPFAPTWTFGLSVASFTGTPPLWGTALNYGQWYTVVTSYNAATDVSELWVDPVDASSPKLTVSDATARHYAVQAYALRQFSGGNWIGNIDDIGIGTSFEESCTQEVPALNTTWGQVKSAYR
jgi:hypothetical protein